MQKEDFTETKPYCVLHSHLIFPSICQTFFYWKPWSKNMLYTNIADERTERHNNLICHTRPVGKKLYSLLIVSIWNNLKQFETIQNNLKRTTTYSEFKSGPRYNRNSLVPNRYTIHQSTPHVLNSSCPVSVMSLFYAAGGKKGDFLRTHS